MQTLISVDSATHTTIDGLLELSITADLDDGNGNTSGIPYGWSNTINDHHGIYPQVSTWMAANPNFPIADYVVPALTSVDIYTERDRRLALGFDYNFGDARGTQHIGTTTADMLGWDDVTKWATAMNGLANTTATLTIATDNGIAVISPSDWFKILSGATDFRQPIWQGSFYLLLQNPIPTDYASNNAYWTANT
jgi:hypothetical protein